MRAASEKQAREAEAARRKAELASAQEAACKKEQGKLEELTAKGSEGSGIDDLKSFSKTVTCDRLGPLVVATLDKFNTEAAKRAAALPNSPELVRSAQTQLARLGCLTGKVDGTLNTTKSALGRYMSIKGQPSNSTDVTEGSGRRSDQANRPGLPAGMQDGRNGERRDLRRHRKTGGAGSRHREAGGARNRLAAQER